MLRHFKAGKRYRITAFMQPPSKSQEALLGNSVRCIYDKSLESYSDLYVEGGLYVQVLTGSLKHARFTLSAVQIKLLRDRKRCFCKAFRYPHFPSHECKEFTND